MIVYLDTSAVVPILIAEPTTNTCRRIWDDADRRVSSRLTYVEVAAALAMAERHDAVHCASAASLNDTDLVAAAGDTHLLAAWRSLGIAVLDTHHGP